MRNPEIFAIWLCKPGTYMMPLLYEACIATWQVMNRDFQTVVYTDNPELKFNLLSKDTTEVRLIQDVIPEVLEEANKIITDDVPAGMRFAHRSDYIRYSILAKFGGIYVDCDLVCISPIEELVKNNIEEGIGVIMAYEDTMRICNAFLACLNEDGKMFYEDIVDNYKKRYVKTSYTYNSIKYPMLLKNRLQGAVTILPFKEGMFYPNWEKNENGDLGILKTDIAPDCVRGYGVHLYNTDPKWKEFRDMLTANLYCYDTLNWWFLKHINECMDKYMDMMVNSETRNILMDNVLVKNLKELYGEQYLDQFKAKGGIVVEPIIEEKYQDPSESSYKKYECVGYNIRRSEDGK